MVIFAFLRLIPLWTNNTNYCHSFKPSATAATCHLSMDIMIESNRPTTSEESPISESFIGQLRRLEEVHSFHETASMDQRRYGISPRKHTDMIQSVESTVELILAYFGQARSEFNKIYLKDDIQVVIEGIPTVKDISRGVLKASKRLPSLLTILEVLKEDRHLCKEHEDKSDDDHLPPTPSSDSHPKVLKRKAVDPTSTDRLFAAAEKIEEAIAQWHELHALALILQERISIAAEWEEFHNFIMHDIENEIDSCSLDLAIIRERNTMSQGTSDLDFLLQSLNQTPPEGCQKLPFKSKAEQKNITQ